MSEETIQPKKTRNRRPKGQSMPVMRELLGLMDQRTTIMNQIRTKRMELAQLDVSLQALATEIQWRANIFSMTPKQEGVQESFPMSPGAPMAVPGVQFAPAIPQFIAPSAGVQFAPAQEAPAPTPYDAILAKRRAQLGNVGSAQADLTSMS